MKKRCLFCCWVLNKIANGRDGKGKEVFFIGGFRMKLEMGEMGREKKCFLLLGFEGKMQMVENTHRPNTYKS